MKPVIGTVLSSKPIKLSKAAAVLSKFASSDTCATAEIAAYIAHASAAFDELAEYHRALKQEVCNGGGSGLVGGERERRDLDGFGGEKRKKKNREKVGASEGYGGFDTKKKREGKVEEGCGVEMENGEHGMKSHKERRKGKAEEEQRDREGYIQKIYKKKNREKVDAFEDGGGKGRENGEHSHNKKRIVHERALGQDGIEEHDQRSHREKRREKADGAEEGGGEEKENGEFSLRNHEKKILDNEEGERMRRKKKKRKHAEEAAAEGEDGRGDDHHKKRRVQVK